MSRFLGQFALILAIAACQNNNSAQVEALDLSIDDQEVTEVQPSTDVWEVTTEILQSDDLVQESSGVDEGMAEIFVPDEEVFDDSKDISPLEETVEVVPEVVQDDGISEVLHDPDLEGPFKTWTHKADVLRKNRTISVVAHVPEGQGKWPLIVFLPGFQVSTDLYKVTVDRLASHGFIVIRATPSGSLLNVNHVEMMEDARAVIDWALDSSGPLKGLADASRIGIMGHSLGGKISVMTAFADTRVRAVFAMDPVNGAHPITGYSSSLPDIVPDQVAPLTIPLGFPGEDWSASHSAPFSQPCAPADQNFRTFYNAASSASWKALWALQGADHQDFVDDPEACGFVCSVCPDGPGDDHAQIAAVRTLMVAFFRMHLVGEKDMEDWLVGNKVPAEVTELQHMP